MSTRSLTIVKDEEGKVCLNMYRQCDGYPSGIGSELYEFLKDIVMVNGIGAQKDHIANGPHCLAAQIVAHFKDGPGGVCLYNPSSKDLGQEYEYHITAGDSGITVKLLDACFRRPKTMYQGGLEGFGAYCAAER